jgi:hypothetical protein
VKWSFNDWNITYIERERERAPCAYRARRASLGHIGNCGISGFGTQSIGGHRRRAPAGRKQADTSRVRQHTVSTGTGGQEQADTIINRRAPAGTD